MSRAAPVLVVGAGVGGLSAALRLARSGMRVRVFEARAVLGGLASPVDAGGLRLDGGPYVLLDRAGLEWAFGALGLDLQALALRRIEHVYSVASQPGAPTVHIHADLERTIEGLERHWPGSGARYRTLVAWGADVHRRLQHALYVPRPGPRELLRGGAWRHARSLTRSLGETLQRFALPGEIVDAVSVWTHVAGQDLDSAPSFMGVVPALIHGVGAYHPAEGVAAVAAALARAAREAGVEIEAGQAVERIVTRAGRVTGVETGSGFWPCEAVVSNAGLATYLRLLDALPEPARRALEALPLQSPGVGAYLAVSAHGEGPYLRFRIPRAREKSRDDVVRCRLLVSSAVGRSAAGAGEQPARLMAPVPHDWAARAGRAGQEALLDQLLDEPWWREGLADARVVARRVPADWGAEFRLWRDAMNPVMTARLALRGRLRHRSPWVRGLYLAGGATHPGQWVSFCAISGVHAADAACADLR